MKRILAMPKIMAQARAEEIVAKGIPIISILDHKEPAIFNEGKTLTLWFGDLAPRTSHVHYPWSPAMTLGQAWDIIKFVDAHKESPIMFVHCSAGISRSGAVATFITEMHKLDNDQFMKDNPQILPNNWVFNMLYYALGTIPNSLEVKD